MSYSERQDLDISLIPGQEEKSNKKRTALLVAGALVVVLVIVSVSIASTSSGSVAAEGDVDDYDIYDTYQDPWLAYKYTLEGTDVDAVCNDGSPGMYYLRTSPEGNHDDKWLIRFKGPDFCFDPLCMAERAIVMPRQITSTVMPDTEVIDSVTPEEGAAGGILLADAEINPHFYDDNHVQVHYCSSDEWAGDLEKPMQIPAGDETYDAAEKIFPDGIYFRGKKIFEATVTQLFNDHDMASCSRATWIFEGESSIAGLLHAEWLKAKYDELAPDCDVRIVLDAAWYPKHDCYDEPYDGFDSWPNMMATGYAAWDSASSLSETCKSATTEDGTPYTYHCMLAPYAVPLLPTDLPIFFVQNLFASMEIVYSYGLHSDYWWNEDSEDWMVSWAQTTNDQILDLERWKDHNTKDGVYTTQCARDDVFSTYAMLGILVDCNGNCALTDPLDALWDWLDEEDLGDLENEDNYWYDDCGWVPDCATTDTEDYCYHAGSYGLPILDPWSGEHNPACDATTWD